MDKTVSDFRGPKPVTTGYAMNDQTHAVEPSKRLTSLDIYRGMTMLAMMAHTLGLKDLAHLPVVGLVYRQLNHADWVGFHFEDFILPSFLFVMGVSVCAGGYFLLGKTTPGKRGTTASPSNILFKDKRPVLVSGSPSISILPNLVQNTTNILDFDIPIEESVNRPRFGGRSIDHPGAAVIEADFNPTVRKKVEEKGFRFDVVNPWNWHHGAFEGIYVDPANGTIQACGDPRRCSKAEGL